MTSVIQHWKRVLAERQKTASELRKRLAVHHGKAPRLARAYARWQRLVVQAKRGLARAEQANTPRAQALAWARSKIGITESPPGSNQNPRNLTNWQRTIANGASWLIGQPWCGVFLGMALTTAGVKVNFRVASVADIEDDARAGHNGWEKLVPLAQARPGDAAIMFGRGVHVELIESLNLPAGTITNIGGNTSFSDSGSQSNGGCVARRTRAVSQVYAIARPRYP